ncbi:3-oxoacyl-[acyl-carrier-protein] reductase FabG-like [Helicoverpa zea]|uniref:3-oxoacyl-[acyl-carrier-protein] reductase FabG-like n=1 Tax=Helicoverpa zea TaxID=7113 RepID=UPI001F55E670|nr:3-oxoacyl-[acyl-carrier-protein] reductase FabG-like [Helicoverpa zea]
MSFANKVVIITGASSGIGAATAILFSQEGANVVLVGRNEIKLASVARKCENPLIIKADVTDMDDAKRMIAETIDTHGKIDVLVNNAGIVRYESILDENVLETFDALIDTNLRALFNITRLAVPYLIETKGNIVNISSIAGKIVPDSRLVAYGISKAGVDNFTKGLALELSKYGVRVNAISPGPVKTDILENAGDETPWECFTPAMPLGKVGEPDDIGHLVLFLASDKAGSITGVDYVCDNGVMLK